MKLHYSQTNLRLPLSPFKVSVPYEITLLSNGLRRITLLGAVSVPYEITLLSNLSVLYAVVWRVSVPYEITLLSNLYFTQQWDAVFQYLMKLHYSQTKHGGKAVKISFSTL